MRVPMFMGATVDMLIEARMQQLGTLLGILARQLTGEPTRPIVLMIGSGMSLPDHASPGVASAATIARKATEALLKHGVIDAGERDLTLSYQQAFERLIDLPGGQADADRLIRGAVLAARTDTPAQDPDALATGLDGIRAAELEADAAGWGLPGGLRDLGVLLTRYPKVFGNVVLTTNFDPLLETAIRRASGRALTLAIDDRDGFHHVLTSDAKVVHLHGYWFGSHTLHSRAQLVSRHIPDEMALAAGLRRLFKGKHVVVIGYGGWDDVFMHALARSAVEDEAHISWCLFESEEVASANRRDEVLERLDVAAEKINFYRGVSGSGFATGLRQTFEAIRPADDIEQFLRCLLRAILADPARFLSEQLLSDHMRPLLQFGELEIVKAAFACVEFHIAHPDHWRDASPEVLREIDLGPTAIRAFLADGFQDRENDSAMANMQFDDLGRPSILLPLANVHRSICCYEEARKSGNLAKGYPDFGIYRVAKTPYWVFAVQAIHGVYRSLAGYRGGVVERYVVQGLIDAMYSALVNRRPGGLPDGPVIPW